MSGILYLTNLIAFYSKMTALVDGEQSMLFISTVECLLTLSPITSHRQTTVIGTR